MELCAEDTTVQENEEEHKPKDQEDCKIRSKAPNKKRKRSNMEKSLDVKNFLTQYHKKKQKGKSTFMLSIKTATTLFIFKLETTNPQGPVFQNRS